MNILTLSTRPLKNQNVRKISILIFFFFAFFSGISLLAGTTGKIKGNVVDSDGFPVIGANIILQDTYLGAASDIEGDFIISNVPPGTYNLVVSAIGFHKVTVTNVLVRIDLTTNIDVNMTSETIDLDEIVVVAEQPLITKDLTSSSAIVTSEDIQMMPVDDFQQVVNLQAGVVDGHFRGGRSNEVAYLVDGIAVNDAFSGGMSLEVENNSIRQLEVISGTFNAEYGQAMSGVVNIVTKDGGQKYEGSVSGYVGSYFTTDTQIFENLNKVDLEGPRDFQFDLSGPTGLKDLTFFVSGRYYVDNGFMYGKRVYNTSDIGPTFPNPQDPNFWINNNTGDGAFVPMNPTDKKSVNAKLTYTLPGWKFSINSFFDDNWNKYYSHDYRLTPDGIQNHYRTNFVNTFIASFYPSQSTLTSLKDIQ